jgi:hypothetical protein
VGFFACCGIYALPRSLQSDSLWAAYVTLMGSCVLILEVYFTFVAPEPA